MVNKAYQRWEPASTCKPKDNLISSSYRNFVSFKPSYEEEKVNMFLLLAHDYAKLWKAENVAVTVKRFESVGEADEHLCRRYVLRALYKKQRLEEEDKPRFIMKRFRNIPSKVKQFMGFPNMPKEKLENEEPDEEFDNIFPSAADSNEVLRAKLANSLIKDDCVSIPDCNVLTAAISPREIKQKEEKCRVSSSVARTNLVD